MSKTLSQLETDILTRCAQFVGKKDTDLFDYFGIRPIRGDYSKNARRLVVDRLLNLDIDKNKRAELARQGIVIKTMRVNSRGIPIESISFPAFEFKMLVEESWATSTLRESLMETTYLFVVFCQVDDSTYQFRGVKFWQMSDDDREGGVRKGWLQTVNTLKQGVMLAYDPKQNRVNNDLLAASAELIIHVRPHSTKSSYHAGSRFADQLPTPAKWTNKPEDYSTDWMTKQSFWLNRRYVAKQIAELLS